MGLCLSCNFEEHPRDTQRRHYTKLDKTQTTKNKDKLRSFSLLASTDITHNECAICLEEFKIGNHVQYLGCSHYFHGDCYNKWRIKKNGGLCPLCRAKIFD